MHRSIEEIDSIQVVCGSLAEVIVEIELIQYVCGSLVELCRGRVENQKTGEHERRKNYV